MAFAVRSALRNAMNYARQTPVRSFHVAPRLLAAQVSSPRFGTADGRWSQTLSIR